MPRYVLDACVLVPIALTDTLLRLAEKDLYQPLWSDRILGEAEDALGRIRPGGSVARRFADMRQAFPRALVTGWEARESRIQLPDLDDRHVVAAALEGRADGIITNNVKDFPASTLGPLGLEAITPNRFLLNQAEDRPATVLEVIREQSEQTRHPHQTPQEITDLLRREGAPGFATKVAELLAVAPEGTPVSGLSVETSRLAGDDAARGTPAVRSHSGERGVASPGGTQRGRAAGLGPGKPRGRPDQHGYRRRGRGGDLGHRRAQGD